MPSAFIWLITVFLSTDEDKPVKIGFKTFVDGRECRSYFQRLLANLTIDQALNEVFSHHTKISEDEYCMLSVCIHGKHPRRNPTREIIFQLMCLSLFDSWCLESAFSYTEICRI